tara:strand:+ start:12099 stop:12329 length:231 start_codon:yes stop_codon:yes gene_type:complete
MLKFINIKVFILSLSIGLLFVYLSSPQEAPVIVYPTPENIDKVEYKDLAGNCFRFEIDEVVCPQDKNIIKTIPVQQ